MQSRHLVTAPSLPPAFFWQYTGYLVAPTDGQYTLYITSDDGSRLWLDGNLLIENDGVHGAIERSNTTYLIAAIWYPIRYAPVTMQPPGAGQTVPHNWATMSVRC
jgi:hypothetical protein